MNEIMVAGYAVALACGLLWAGNGYRQMRASTRLLCAAGSPQTHIEITVERGVTARHYRTVAGPETAESRARSALARRATDPHAAPALPRPTTPLPGYRTPPPIPWSALTGHVTPLPDDGYTPRSLRAIATDSARMRAVQATGGGRTGVGA